MREVLSVCAVVSCSIAMAASPEQVDSRIPSCIPLEKILAWNMPGVRDICALEPEFFGAPIQTEAQLKRAEHSLTSGILQTLAKRADGKPKSGFAVKGFGVEALKNAHAVLANHEKPMNSFVRGDDVTVVFFSHVSGTYVHLKQVGLHSDGVEVQYEFVPHIDAELTFHLALIPLGKLEPGEYKVRIVRAPLRKQFVSLADESSLKELAEHSVCKPFRFVVRRADGGG